jgi:hypothetical protein
MIEYVIDDVNHLIRVWMTGSNRCANLAAHYSRVLKDPRYDPTFDSLFQIDGEADGPIVTELGEVKMLLEMVAQCQAATKWAVVIPLGFKRTVVEFLLKGVELKSVTMRFFGNEADASAWLNVGRTSLITAWDHDAMQRASLNAANNSQNSPAVN